jgi:hypothetical protein
MNDRRVGDSIIKGGFGNYAFVEGSSLVAGLRCNGRKITKASRNCEYFMGVEGFAKDV